VLALADRADREGWRLVILDVGLDTATSSGRLVLGMLALAARFEHDRISERQTEKFRELWQQGRPRGRVSADRSVADRMIAMREAGQTLDRIATTLNGEGIPTARSSAHGWRRSSVRSAIETRRLELAAQACAPNGGHDGAAARSAYRASRRPRRRTWEQPAVAGRSRRQAPDHPRGQDAQLALGLPGPKGGFAFAAVPFPPLALVGTVAVPRDPRHLREKESVRQGRLRRRAARS
jgi:hypothetical protein